MKLYHISRNLNFKENFYPRIPKILSEDENKEIKRICFSKSIEGALTAMPFSLANECYEENTAFFRVYEYEVEDINSILSSEYLYKNDLVRDSIITKEVWVTEEIFFKPKNSYIIGIYSFENTVKDFVPANIYYEAMKKDGDYIGLYMDKISSFIPSIAVIKSIEYMKISEDLSELNKFKDDIYGFKDEILNKESCNYGDYSFLIKKKNGNLESKEIF